MGLLDWLKSKKARRDDSHDSQLPKTIEQDPLDKMSTPGLHLSTQLTTLTKPSNEEIQKAIDLAANAYDEFVLLEWIDDFKHKTYLYGVGFGTSYHIEYRPKNLPNGHVYVREGVSIDEAKQLYLTFKQTHRVTISFEWHLQEQFS